MEPVPHERKQEEKRGETVDEPLLVPLPFPDTEELEQLWLQAQDPYPPASDYELYGGDPVQVYPRLWLGGYNVVRTPRWTQQQKITMIVSVCPRQPAWISESPVSHLHIPVTDSPNTDLLKWLPMVSLVLHNERVAGGSIYVHCYAGISRSATIVLAYLNTLCPYHFTNDAALEMLQHVRPRVQPNTGFMDQLYNYAIRYRDDVRQQIRDDYHMKPDAVALDNLDDEWFEAHYPDVVLNRILGKSRMC